MKRSFNLRFFPRNNNSGLKPVYAVFLFILVTNKKQKFMLLEDFSTVESTNSQEGLHTTLLKINKDHHLYKGHFPHRPVTPGVMLMQLFKEDAERSSGKMLQLKKALNVKFMAVVNPNEDPELVLEYSLEEIEGDLSLKGVAKHKNVIAIKFNARYKFLNS